MAPLLVLRHAAEAQGERHAQQRKISQQSEVIGISQERRLLLDAGVNHPQGFLMSGEGV